MNKAFIDTSAWIALLNKDEISHEEAVKIYKQKLKGYHLYTSNMVVGETYTWLRRKAGPGLSLQFLESVEKKAKLNQITLIYSNAILEETARSTLKKYQDQTFSYVDAVSFAIMMNHKIARAFAYNQHFITAGFSLID